MSIQKKKYTKKCGTSTTKYYAVVFNPILGKPQWSKAYSTVKEAKVQESVMIQEIHNQKYVANKVVFSELFESWYVGATSEYANTTLKTYADLTKRLLFPRFESCFVDEIRPIDIQRFVNGLASEYSAETVNKVINILSVLFKFAVSLKLTTDNPVANIKRKKVNVDKKEVWSSSEIQSFLQYHDVKSSPYYALLALAFSTGMRPSEICGLAQGDLSDSGVLTLHRGYDKYGCLTSMKTSGSHRAIQLPDTLHKLIVKRVEMQLLQHQLFEGDYEENDFLFKQINGAPINPETLSKAFKKLLKRYNKESDTPLPDICLYSASRHSFGTNMIVEERVPTAIVSSIMGNSERVLVSRYVHVKDSVQATVLNNYQSQIFVG